jgi:hypothetical protein
MCIKLHNGLPLELRKSDGFEDFKHKLKLFLVDHFIHCKIFSERAVIV